MLLSVIIPTRNEREGISDVIKATKRALNGYSHEIIVVDKSTDDTAILAAQAGAVVVRQTHRGGVGAAFREGFTHASGKVIVTLDGDGSYDPADIPKVIEPILSSVADFVNGNRLTEKREKGSITKLNLVGNKALTWLGNIVFRADVKDSQSGMKAATRDLLERMSLFESGFPTVSELVGEAVRARGRIVEIPITYSIRKGKTKLRPMVDGLRIYFATILLLRDYNPLLLFGSLGLFLIALGSLTSTPVVAEFLERGTFHFLGRALLSSVLIISGFFSILVGLVLDSANFSIRRLEARILGLGAQRQRLTFAERTREAASQSAQETYTPPPSVEPSESELASPKILETISIRRAVADALREAEYSASAPGVLKGESGIDYNFDVVASRKDKTWVLDICADTTTEADAVLSLFAKILDVKPDKATLLAKPMITPQTGKLAQMYNIQVVVGNSAVQLSDVIKLIASETASKETTLGSP